MKDTATKSATSQICKLLCCSLKDDTTRMNDRNKHKVMGQTNHQTADPKANASAFLFFPNAHFLKIIFSLPVLSHWVLPDTKNQHLAIPKKPIFLPTITTVRNKFIILQL